MSAITLVRQAPTEITEADREAVRRVLFGVVDGLGERGRSQWRRFIGALMRLTPGELIDIHTHQARSNAFHRRHMLIETRVFEAQECFDDFEQFRNWLKIGAGHCDWFPGPKGGIVPVPRSISFAQLEDADMREVHDAMIRFLRTAPAIKALWPKLPAAQRFGAVEALMYEFGE